MNIEEELYYTNELWRLDHIHMANKLIELSMIGTARKNMSRYQCWVSGINHLKECYIVNKSFEDIYDISLFNLLQDKLR